MERDQEKHGLVETGLGTGFPSDRATGKKRDREKGLAQSRASNRQDDMRYPSGFQK